MMNDSHDEDDADEDDEAHEAADVDDEDDVTATVTTTPTCFDKNVFQFLLRKTRLFSQAEGANMSIALSHLSHLKNAKWPNGSVFVNKISKRDERVAASASAY